MLYPCIRLLGQLSVSPVGVTAYRTLLLHLVPHTLVLESSLFNVNVQVPAMTLLLFERPISYARLQPLFLCIYDLLSSAALVPSQPPTVELDYL